LFSITKRLVGILGLEVQELDYIGSLSKIKLLELDAALKIALAVEAEFD